MGFQIKLKKYVSCNPAIPLLSIYPKEILTQEICTIILIPILFQTEKKLTQISVDKKVSCSLFIN